MLILTEIIHAIQWALGRLNILHKNLGIILR
jgi:hypothetical protein